MKAMDIYNTMRRLDSEKERSARALAHSILLQSGDSVTKGLTKNYKKAFDEFNEFANREVKIRKVKP